MRTRHAVITTLFLAMGLSVIWMGGWARATLGDVLIVPFLVHLLGIFVPKRVVWRIAGVGLLAVVTELQQLLDWVGPDAPAWLHLTVGSTFDPLDLVAYAVGIAIAVGTSLLARGLRRPLPTEAT